MIYEYIMDKNDLSEYLKILNLSKDIIIIKVNWCNDREGYFTDCKTLSFFIKGLKKAYKKAKIIITEAYSYERNDPVLEFSPEEENKRKDIIRKNDIYFLKKQGFKKFFEDENLTYINVTEEAWNNKNIDADIIKKIVKEKYNYELKNKELYGCIPKALFRYKGKSLISLSKIKGIILPGFLFFTLSMKNLFGLIPKTCRRNYHGKPKLVNTIIDMNVIYRSLFDVVGISEALFNTLFISEKPHVIENSGCMAASRDLVTLDAAIIKSLSFNPYDRHFITMSENVFNKVNKKDLLLTNIKDYFYPLLNKYIDIDAIKKSKEVIHYKI